MNSSLNDYLKNPLWPILVEVVHALVMYLQHRAYTRDVLLGEKSDLTPQELATKLSIPMGEALVILYELREKTEGDKISQ